VEGVLAHRSTATGEIQFARSDIDLIVRLHDDRVTPARMLSLIRLFHTIKYANIALGEVETHLEQEWLDWFAVDSYRGSMERRSALRMYGPEQPRPHHAVRQSHAIRRFVLWFHDHAFVAWNAKNKRNLRKIALEMWNAYAVAIGLMDEPLLTRPEMERECLKHEDPNWVGELGTSPDRAVQFMLELAQRLHAAVAPALGPRPEVEEVSVAQPPYLKPAQWVSVSGPKAAIPELPERARHTSPELFDLFFRYVQPFYYSLMPERLLELGLAPPTTAQQADSLRFHYHGQVLRYPGLMSPFAGSAVVAARFAAEAIPRLEAGEIYDAPLLEPLKPYPTIPEYYNEKFTKLSDQHRDLWPRLSGVPGLEPS